MSVSSEKAKGRGVHLLMGIIFFLVFDAILALGLLVWVTVSDRRGSVPGHHLIVVGDGVLLMSERVVVASFKTPPRAYFLFSASHSSLAAVKTEPLGVCIEGQLSARMSAATCLVDVHKAAEGGGTFPRLPGILALRWDELQPGSGVARRALGEETLETYTFSSRNPRGGTIHIEAAATRESDRFIRLFWVAREDGQVNLEVIGKRPWWLIWRAAAGIMERLVGYSLERGAGGFGLAGQS